MHSYINLQERKEKKRKKNTIWHWFRFHNYQLYAESEFAADGERFESRVRKLFVNLWLQ